MKSALHQRLLFVLFLFQITATTGGQAQEDAGQAGLELVVVQPPMQNGGSG